MVVADHGKLGRPAMVSLATLDEVDVFVSDGALAPAHRRLLRQHDIELHLSS
jgi:DeoR/GlpR family transcriptional regulator of sugar metabolism